MSLLKDKTLCIIGLGYVGLPTALTFAQAGYTVRGYDKNARLVQQLNAGETEMDEAGIENLLRQNLASGRFKAFEQVQPADAYFICVPTPVAGQEKKPDLTAVFSAVEAIKGVVKAGDLVVLESTSPVGTTRRIYEELSAKGAIFSAYCPERILPGKVLEELSSLDRVIGGIDAESTMVAKSYFTNLTKGQCYETDAETAEFVKLAENSFRDVNIAFANELKHLCGAHGVDVEEVRALANKHPRVDILQAGIGVGGHCIPVDPWFLVHASSAGGPSVIHSARLLNDQQPPFIAGQILKAAQVSGAKRLAIFGLTYKANVNDFRESPAMEIVHHIAAAPFLIDVYDPYLAGQSLFGTLSNIEAQGLAQMREADLYVFLVAHDVFKDVLRKLTSEGKMVTDFCGLARLSAGAAQAKIIAFAKAN